MGSATSAPAFETGPENSVVDGFTSLLDEVDSEEIAARYDIGLHSNRIGFLEHVKIGLRLGIADPKTLEDLAQQTDVYADLEPISKGHFSKLTTRRPAQAVAELATAVLGHPSLYHPAGVARKRLEHLRDRQIIGCDATRLPLRTTLVVIQRVVRSESVRVDREWLLLATHEKKPNRRLVRRFRGDHVSLPATAVNEREHGRFVTLVGSTPARGETSRARRPVALTTLQPGRNVQFVNLDGTAQLDRRRVERFGETLDAPVKCLVREIEFGGELADTGVEPDERIDHEEPLVEHDLRVREDRAGLVVERAVTILTEIPLKGSVAAVLDYR